MTKSATTPLQHNQQFFEENVIKKIHQQNTLKLCERLICFFSSLFLSICHGSV